MKDWRLELNRELTVWGCDDGPGIDEKVIFRAEEVINVRHSAVSIFGREGHWIPPNVSHLILLPPFSLKRWDRLHLHTFAGTDGVELRKGTRVMTLHLGLPAPIRLSVRAWDILSLCDWSTADGSSTHWAEFHF